MDGPAHHGERTLTGLIESAARSVPSAVAVHYGGAAVTYGALAEESRRVAMGLTRIGVGAGDRVAVWLPNSPAWLALHLACARLGVITVAVNTRFRSAELEDILGRSEAKVLALWPGFSGIDFPGILDAVDPESLAKLDTLILYGEASDGARPSPARTTVCYSDLAAQPPLVNDRASSDAGCIVFTTSGTTKAPKFVLHRQHSIVDHANDVAAGFRYAEDGAVLLQALPLCGTFGHAQAIATLAARQPMVMTSRFNAEESVRLIASHEVTHFNGSDDMLRLILDAAGEDDLRSLRFCGYAAFANPGDGDLVAYADRLGVRLLGLYGMSEVQALYARQPEDGAPEQRAKAGGRLTSPHGAARVHDPESGAELPPGEAGELYLAGPSRFAEYWGDPGATAETITEDGFVRTGDLATLTGDGGFTFLTRLGDGLRLGGFLVNPGEIESYVERHPAVAACQTVAVTTGSGTRPVAFVLPTPGMAFDEEDLHAHCAEGMARFKVPACFIPLDAFPTTPSPNGEKIQRAKLREMAAERLA